MARAWKREWGIFLAAVAGLLMLAATPFAVNWLKEPMAARAEPLLVAFPHSKHTDTGCPVCHHNLKDKTKTEGEPCIHCHLGPNPKLKRGIEAEFHDFCRGCHAARARTFAKHGPIRSCSGCHKENYLP